MAARPQRALFRVQNHARSSIKAIVTTRIMMNRVTRMVEDVLVGSVEEVGRRLNGGVIDGQKSRKENVASGLNARWVE